ncbi:MAG: hypothetical protein KY476_12315 [Planctomycetes bacterium]|nr:hypothetical protein [Planctomycetota bacterium]
MLCRCAIAVWAAALALEPPPLSAQDPPSTPAATGVAAREAASSTEAAPMPAVESVVPGSVIYMPGPGGRLVPVLSAEELREFRRWRDQQAAAAVPDYSLTSIGVTGRADEESAELTAEVELQVNRADADVLVPLRLSEGRLIDTAHEGEGEASFGGFDARDGYRWWFRGRGRHKLTLRMTVPVQKQLPNRRVSLSVPSAAASFLKLEVPLPPARVTVVPVNGASVRKEAKGRDATEIAVFARDRITAVWQPLPTTRASETVLQAQTKIELEVTDESVLLNPVTQRIQALGGSFDSVTVTLPDGFEVLDVTVGDRPAQPQPAPPGAEPSPSGGRRVTLALSEHTTGPLEIRWRLRAALPQAGRISLSGFDVDKAISQGGEIRLAATEGLQIVRREGSFVHRIGAGGSAAGSRPVAAYAFWRQPFSLSFDVQEVAPFVTAEAVQSLLVRENRMELVAATDLEVHEGAVDELEFRWPGLSEQGWVVRAEPSGLVDGTPRYQPADETLRLPLLRPKTGRFRVILRAERPIIPAAEPFLLTLPVLAASSPPQTVLVTARDDRVEAALDPAGDFAMHPVSERMAGLLQGGVEEFGLGPEFARYHRTQSATTAPLLAFRVLVTVHQQQVSTSSLALIRAEEEMLEVVQEISYDVSYERLSQVRLVIPRAVAGSGAGRLVVAERLEDGSLVPLSAGRVEVDSNGAQHVRYALSKPRLGSFDIVATFAAQRPDAPPRPADESVAVVTIPLVRSADAAFVSNRVRLSTAPSLDARLVDAGWSLGLALDNEPEWLGPRDAAAVSVELSAEEAPAAAGVAIPRALVRARLGADGTVRIRAQFRVRGDVPALDLVVPPEVEQVRYYWDEIELDAEPVEKVQAGPSRVRLAIPEAERGGEHLLTVDGRMEQDAPAALAWQWSFPVPRPADVWVEQTICELALPERRHLLTEPHGTLPQYEWQRRGILWSRRSLPDVPGPDEWIGAASGPAAAEAMAGGNRYRFERFGPVERLEFSTLSAGGVVVFGAGVAWALAFLLLKARAARSALTLLAVVLAVAVAWVWFPAPLQLFVQPALAGFVLAVAGVLLDRLLRRRRRVPALTFSSPSDFAVAATTHSSFERALSSGGVGSDDATAMRSARQHLEPVSTATPHAGSG